LTSNTTAYETESESRVSVVAEARIARQTPFAMATMTLKLRRDQRWMSPTLVCSILNVTVHVI